MSRLRPPRQRGGELFVSRYDTRGHEHAQPIPLLHRMLCATAGKRDVPAIAVGEYTDTLPTTRWLTRNAKTASEAMERELLDGEARAAQPAREADRVHRSIMQLVAQRPSLVAAVTAAESREVPTVQSIVRTPGEQHVDESVLLARLLREWQASVTVAKSQLAELDLEVRRQEQVESDLLALTGKVFAIARTRALGAHDYHERRSSIYLRQLINAHEHGARLQALLGSEGTVPLPDWVSQPSPWLPGMHRVGIDIHTPIEEQNS